MSYMFLWHVKNKLDVTVLGHLRVVYTFRVAEVLRAADQSHADDPLDISIKMWSNYY